DRDTHGAEGLRYRPAAVKLELALGGRLGHVNRHRQALLAGPGREALHERRTYRVRRVWRDADPHAPRPLRRPEAVHGSGGPLEDLVGVGCPGAQHLPVSDPFEVAVGQQQLHYARIGDDVADDPYAAVLQLGQAALRRFQAAAAPAPEGHDLSDERLVAAGPVKHVAEVEVGVSVDRCGAYRQAGRQHARGGVALQRL